MVFLVGCLRPVSFLLQFIFMIKFNDFSMLSWNIRGAHNNKAKRHLKDLIRKFQPCILIIMETHIAFARTEVFWHGVGFSPIQIIEAHGHSGGLWVLKNNGSKPRCSMSTLKLLLLISWNWGVNLGFVLASTQSPCRLIDLSYGNTLKI